MGDRRDRTRADRVRSRSLHVGAVTAVVGQGRKLAVAGDSVWVVGSLALIGFSDVLSPSGEIAVAGVSLVVAGFAIAQFFGLRRLTRAGA
jgi:hypothetical protein